MCSTKPSRLMAMLNKIVVFAVIVATSFACSCNQESGQQIDTKQLREPMIEYNKTLMQQEDTQIEQYILRRNWAMQKTGSGLRYKIDKQGEGELAKLGQVAKVNFSVYLLDGTLCYSSDSLGPKQFLIGMDNIESGIHEGVQLLNKGAKATFILPFRLAHGITGDQNKIPGKSTLVCIVELLEIKEK